MIIFDWIKHGGLLLTQGGPVMYIILLVSIGGVAISLERIWHFTRARTDHRRMLADVKDLLVDDFVYKAMARCDEDRGPVAHILKAVLKNKDREPDTIRDAIDAAALEEIPRLERRVSGLGTIANVSTLLGLLGTIIGMIVTFSSVADQMTGLVNVNLLADGISQAMLTTAFGLSVAIPTTVVHAYLVSEIKKFTVAMEHSAAELIHFLEHQPQKEADAI